MRKDTVALDSKRLNGYERLEPVGKSVLSSIVAGVAIVIGILVVCIPLIWIITTSIKPGDQIFHMPVIYIPKQLTFEHYITAWRTRPILQWYINTLIVSITSTGLGILLSTLAGYGFSRFRIKGKMPILIAILFSQMFPQILIVIPYFVWMSRLNLINSYQSLILAYLGGILPFTIWTLKGFFDTIPKELDQAAKIDGCGEIATFLKIVLPLSAPGLAAATLFAFLTAWNNYLLTVILVTDSRMQTLNVGVTMFISDFAIAWGPLNAVVVLTAFPIIIVFAFLEKYMISGLTSGAVKG